MSAGGRYLGETQMGRCEDQFWVSDFQLEDDFFGERERYIVVTCNRICYGTFRAVL